MDFLGPLLDINNEVILDRCAISEYAYAPTRKTDNEFRLSWKEFHNAILLGLMRNPLFILCTHKPVEFKEDVLAKENWGACMKLYFEFFTHNGIDPLYYDYDLGGCIWFHGFPKYMNPFTEGSADISQLVKAHDYLVQEAGWWKSMWAEGKGAIGSQHPTMLIIGERLGPNNINNLPFEQGPTGYMLSDAIVKASIPLGRIAITNLVKDIRGATRKPNGQDLDLLMLELEHLKPKGVLLMGATAKSCTKLLNSQGVPYFHIEHLGSLHHKGVAKQEMPRWWAEFRRIYDLILGMQED